MYCQKHKEVVKSSICQERNCLVVSSFIFSLSVCSTSETMLNRQLMWKQLALKNTWSTVALLYFFLAAVTIFSPHCFKFIFAMETKWVMILKNLALNLFSRNIWIKMHDLYILISGQTGLTRVNSGKYPESLSMQVSILTVPDGA